MARNVVVIERSDIERHGCFCNCDIFSHKVQNDISKEITQTKRFVLHKCELGICM